MKKLKLDHTQALQVIGGQVRQTWRMFDDKDLTVNDYLSLVDKVQPKAPQTWRVIGTARVTRVVEKRLSNITPEDQQHGERYDSLQAMLKVFRQRYGDNVEGDTVVKLVYFDFTPANAGSGVEPAPRIKLGEQVVLYADGGSRGNPGPSACGYVVMAGDEVLIDKGVYLGITTNNQAEYHGLKGGLEEAKAMGARRVDVRLDSLLVVNQMKGIFKVKNRDLWPIHEAVKQLVAEFEHVSFTHVPRELNKLADAAVNRVLDEHMASR